MSARAKSWLPGVIAIVAAAIAVRVWLNARESEATWERVRERAAALPQPAFPTTGERPHAPLLGASRPGEAAAFYLTAIATGPKNYNDASESDEVWHRTDDPLPANAAELLAPYQPALDALAAGAACNRIEAGTFAGPAWQATIGKGTFLAELVAFAVRHDLQQGKPEVALQRAADLLTFARDQLQIGTGYHEVLGAQWMRFCCARWTDAELPALPEPMRRTLADALQRLDAELPPERDADADCRMMVDIVLRDPRAAGIEPQQLAAYIEAMQSLPPAGAAWRVRERALAAATRRLGQPPETGAAMVEFARRQALAELRMLRMALAHHLGEPMSPLPDPLGDGALQVHDDGADGLRIASRGNPNGILQGEPIERRVRKR